MSSLTHKGHQNFFSYPHAAHTPNKNSNTTRRPFVKDVNALLQLWAWIEEQQQYQQQGNSSCAIDKSVPIVPSVKKTEPFVASSSLEQALTSTTDGNQTDPHSNVGKGIYAGEEK